MLKALNKICNEHKYITNIIQNSKKLRQPYAFPVRLQIKCSNKSSCLYNSNKKKHHFKRMPKFQSSIFQASHLPQRFKKSFKIKRFRQFKFGRKKKQSGKKSSNCFLCRKSGHFAKQCPKSDKKFVKMMQQIACAS